jgi:hypothetical protein
MADDVFRLRRLLQHRGAPLTASGAGRAHLKVIRENVIFSAAVLAEMLIFEVIIIICNNHLRRYG